MQKTIGYRVALDDLDFMGIVSHYQWLLLMERLRTKLCEDQFQRMQSLRLGFVVADAKIQYRKSARYLDHLQLQLEVLSLKGSSALVKHTFVGPDNDVLVVGELTLVCVNEAGRPNAIPDEFRDMFNAMKIAESQKA